MPSANTTRGIIPLQSDGLLTFTDPLTRALSISKRMSAWKHISTHPRRYDQQKSKPGDSSPNRTKATKSPVTSLTPLTWVHPKTGITSTWLQWSDSKMHSSKVTKVHRPAVLPTVQKNTYDPSENSIPEGEDQAGFYSRQLDRAGNPVVSPNWARATPL